MLGDDLGPNCSETGFQGTTAGRCWPTTTPPGFARGEVLDLGCGAGDSIRLFRSVHPEVSWVGADIDESPEVAARTRNDAEFVTFDGHALPFEDGSFELVCCKQVLEHVEHPRELMAEVARVLSRAATWRARPRSSRRSTRQHLQLDALRLHARR